MKIVELCTNGGVISVVITRAHFALDITFFAGQMLSAKLSIKSVTSCEMRFHAIERPWVGRRDRKCKQVSFTAQSG